MKLVKEHIIFEKFEKDSDPIKDMNIGMIREIKKWLETNIIKKYHDHYIQNYIIDNNLEINADYVNIAWTHFNELPKFIKFNKIKISFICCFDTLKTIKYNGPKEVGHNYVIYSKNTDKFTVDDVRKICNVGGTVDIIKR